MAGALATTSNRAWARRLVATVAVVDAAAVGIAGSAYVWVYGMAGKTSGRMLWLSPTTTVAATVLGIAGITVAAITGADVYRRRGAMEVFLYVVASAAVVAAALILLTNAASSTSSGLPGDF
jgi:hypothetical protein